MRRTRFDSENTVFVILSFEGRDPYSLAGGLGVRVTGLAQVLVDHGLTVGSPAHGCLDVRPGRADALAVVA
jgi:hypothetical protein